MRQARFATVFRGTNRAKFGGNRTPVAMGFVDDAADYLPPQTFILAAINYPSTGVVEYCAIRWVTDALPLGRAPRATVQRRIEGADMLAWLLWRLERMERIRVVASALMREFGDEAYAQARRRERKADGDEAGARLGSGRVGRRPLDVRARFSRQIDGDRLGKAADVPDPVCLRNARSGADEFDGEADSSRRRARRNHRRRKYKMAASDDRRAHSRSRGPRSLCPTEGSAEIDSSARMIDAPNGGRPGT